MSKGHKQQQSAAREVKVRGGAGHSLVEENADSSRVRVRRHLGWYAPLPDPDVFVVSCLFKGDDW